MPAEIKPLSTSQRDALLDIADGGWIEARSIDWGGTLKEKPEQAKRRFRTCLGNVKRVTIKALELRGYIQAEPISYEDFYVKLQPKIYRITQAGKLVAIGPQKEESCQAT